MTKKELIKALEPFHEDTMKNYIEILLHTFEVIEADPTGWVDGAYGRCDSIKQRIMINNQQSPDNKLNTLIHESIHAISTINALDLNEQQVSVLATGIQSMLITSIKVDKEHVYFPGEYLHSVIAESQAFREESDA